IANFKLKISNYCREFRPVGFSRIGVAIRFFVAWSLCLAPFSLIKAASTDHYSVLDFGAKGDGQSDDTAAFQKGLDGAGQAGGGEVYAPRGTYFFAGHLNIPNGVTLRGIWESVPAHPGIRNAGLPKPGTDGTTFLVTEERGNEEGSP